MSTFSLFEPLYRWSWDVWCGLSQSWLLSCQSSVMRCWPLQYTENYVKQRLSGAYPDCWQHCGLLGQSPSAACLSIFLTLLVMNFSLYTHNILTSISKSATLDSTKCPEIRTSLWSANRQLDGSGKFNQFPPRIHDNLFNAAYYAVLNKWVFSLDLNTERMSQLMTVAGGEFQVAGVAVTSAPL